MRYAMLPGVTAAAGPVLAGELNAFAEARFHLVRLDALAHTPAMVQHWRAASATEFILRVSSGQPGQSAMSPSDFVTVFASAVESFVAQGVRYLEIQTDPNSAEWGCGVSWADGAAFGAWFTAVAQLWRERLGATIRIGFPALRPSTPSVWGPAPLIEELTFLAGCVPALLAADWAGLSLYWSSRAELRDYHGPLRFLRYYLERFPEQTFFITNFANVAATATPVERGEHYVELLTLLAQYDQIAGACAFPWRAEAAEAVEAVEAAPLAWLEADGTPRATLAPVVVRPPLPDRARLRMTWPTEFRAYNQFYGENQELYATSSNLVGGHNGVDLRVDKSAPETSPIYAALDGTVTQVAFDTTGYGHHLRMRCYGPAGEELELIYAHLTHIDVAVGTVAGRGDVLGWAGSTGFSTGPHLHFGLRVRGVRLPVINDWINPRPYLDPAARGLPRESYARTYVLLPPDTGAAWAAAVLRATWDAHRFTVGGSADDAGIGDLDFRRVIAVNPAAWGDDLEMFFVTHYPGVIYFPLQVSSPEALAEALQTLPPMPVAPPQQPESLRGLPRAAYRRTYLLLPPGVGAPWAQAVVEAAWEQQRLTIGGSADDAGVGDLAERQVLAVNPPAWGADLRIFFDTYYPDVAYRVLLADTPEALRDLLLMAA